MKLPFTSEQFLQLFKDYNLAVFPLQIIMYLLAGIVIYLATTRISMADRIINGILGFFWLWMGIVYHLRFFTAINKAAYLFGSLFVIQGILFFYYGLLKTRLTYNFQANKTGWIAASMILFALAIYPMMSYSLGHRYPTTPTFGLPCPTTIFTFALLLLTDRQAPAVTLIIPFLWSLVGFFAAMQLGIKEDALLPVAAVITIILFVWRRKQVFTLR